MARRGRKRSSKTRGGTRRNLPKSPNVVTELRTHIQGKPAVIRVYRKNWEYPNQLVATVHVGTTQMYNKSPKLGKKKKSRSRR